MNELGIPEGLRLMPTQVAGHTFKKDTNEVGVLQDVEGGYILKPIIKPECGRRELEFYKSLQNPKDPLLLQLKFMVPEFLKEESIMISKREIVFLKLKDLTVGILKPCIMDIKIGQQTWDPLATLEKRAAEDEKYKLCKRVLGLCLQGFQMYSIDGGVLQKYGKEHGKKIDPAGFYHSIALFFNFKPNLYLKLIQEVLRQLIAIREWFNRQRLMHFYASSILIIYDFEQLEKQLNNQQQQQQHQQHHHQQQQQQRNDNYQLINGNLKTQTQTQTQTITATTTFCCNNGAVAAKDVNKSSCDIKCSVFDERYWIKVRMIDFGHVFPAENETLDTNYLKGLNSLIRAVERLLL